MELDVTFDRLLADAKQAVEVVGQQFEKPDDDWTPVVQLCDAQGKWTIAGLFMDKYQYRDVIRLMVKKYDAVFAAAVLSSWTAKVEPHESMAMATGQGAAISERPDRREVLLLYCAGPGRAVALAADIHRHEDAPPTLGEWKDLGLTTGEMANVVSAAFESQH